MRHVSRTHRVAFVFFDRINLVPKTQIKYIDTKNQPADILAEEFSHVMDGIIFCVCSIVLKRCRKEHNKMQVNEESQQNQSR